MSDASSLVVVVFVVIVISSRNYLWDNVMISGTGHYVWRSCTLANVVSPFLFEMFCKPHIV